MYRALLLFCFSFLLTSAGFGQTWTRLQGWGLDLQSVNWVNDQIGYVGGENLLIRTADGGQTWEELAYRFEGRVLDLYFLDEKNGIAVGQNGLAIRTATSGQNWSTMNIPSTSNFTSLSTNKKGVWLIAGQAGELYRSANNGETWARVATDISADIFSVFFYGENLVFLTTDQGGIYRSNDQGQSWEKLNSGVSDTIWDVKFITDQLGYVAGSNGLVMKSSDGGDTWEKLATGTTEILKSLDVSPLNQNTVVASGENATIIRSTNAGTSFSKVNLGTNISRGLNHITFLPDLNQAVAIGGNGYMIRSSNGGSSWTQQMAGYRNDFTVVDFKSDRVGFVAGQKGEFLVSSNYGASFVSRPLPEPIDIAAMDFWNTNYGYVSAPSGKIYRSSNSGTSWVDLSINTSERIDGFYLFATSVLYLAGTGGIITRSYDSGVTWDLAVESNTTENLKDVMFFDFNEGIAVGENGTILYSNGGTEWVNISPITTEHFNALAKVSSSSAVMVGNSGTIVKTDDLGKTFQVIASQTTEDLLSVDFFDDQSGFISGKNGVSLATKDGGNSWELIASGTYRDLKSISASNVNKAYAVGDDGTILTYECIAPTGALSDISGAAQSCLNTQTYSILDGPVSGSQLFWRVDGGEIISGQGSSSIEVSWSKTGKNAVFVDRRNFCGAGETSYMEVIVSDLPASSSSIQGDGSVCQNTENIYSLPNWEGVNYTWTIAGGEITEGQGTASITVNWTTPGSGSITALVENTCGKSESLALPISIHPTPSQPGDIVGANLVALGPQDYEVPQEEGFSYRWNLSGGGSIISGQGSSKVRINWESEGDFVLTVQAQNACDFGPEQVLAVEVNLVTGIDENPDLSGLKLYPNPSDGQFTVEAPFLDRWHSALLVSSLGQIIQENVIVPGQRKLEFVDVRPGLYIVRLEGNQGSETRKIIVH
ncbi:YCF48-related protein [Algoriphagus vanfongensis]|uniref:YCF48-related protein n=1 Tax=Algoriphagus vanfongensis TaxID=426371 RepID=UPI0004255E68|nr:YCF48-related protein [Algoriphagus vanfongensis]